MGSAWSTHASHRLWLGHQPRGTRGLLACKAVLPGSFDGLQEWRYNRLVHTDRGDTIRIISARVANAHERKTYEETR